MTPRNCYIPDATFDRLLADLSGAFMVAATTTGTDLNDVLLEALANAGVMPEYARADEGEGLALAA
ncbi:MAG: hypothetical protein WCZ72_09460 [Gemmobacter sp.]